MEHKESTGAKRILNWLNAIRQNSKTFKIRRERRPKGRVATETEELAKALDKLKESWYRFFEHDVKYSTVTSSHFKENPLFSIKKRFSGLFGQAFLASSGTLCQL